MNSYQETVDAILGIPKFTKEKHTFQVIRDYLEALGHPEQGIRVIHVAGTNGKGSVCRMLSDMLRLSGRRVGGFFSPHLVRMNERIRVNGNEIPDEDLTECYRQVKDAEREHRLPVLTFFEVLFVMALLHFHKEQVEDAVLETGLGGRLDATTSIPAELFVITEIGLDHELYLGNTIEKVAAEKAGIITGPAPLVYHCCETAARVIRKKAADIGCKMIVNCGEAELISEEVVPLGIDFSFRNDYDRYDHVFLPTKALYQVENAITAISAVPMLLSGWEKPRIRELVRSSLSGFRWEGRLEEIRNGLYTDGAHNPSAAARLSESLQALLKERKDIRKRTLIFSASEDKNIHGVLKELGGLPWDTVILTRYTGSRSEELEELRRLLADTFDKNTQIISAEDLQAALEAAGIGTLPDGKAAGPEAGHLVVVTGSLYLVGELKAMFNGSAK